MKKIFTSEQIVKIHQEEYVNKRSSTRELGKKYNCSPAVFRNGFKKQNLVVRIGSQARRKIDLNESYFETIDSEKKAYFLGLLYADGNNLEKVGRVRIGLLASDQQILREFSREIYLGQERIQKFPKSRHLAYLVICNKKISQDLARHGCMNGKTFLLKYPKIDDSLIKHFIRGYFDGDGCLSYTIQKKDNYKKFSFELLSTKELLFGIQNCFEALKIKSSLKQRWPERNNNNLTLRISGNNQILKLCNWLYLDSSIWLERKRQKYLELSEYSKRERQKVGRKCKQN